MNAGYHQEMSYKVQVFWEGFVFSFNITFCAFEENLNFTDNTDSSIWTDLLIFGVSVRIFGIAYLNFEVRTPNEVIIQTVKDIWKIEPMW